MDVTPYITSLGREITALAETSGSEAQALVERLTGALESAIRLTLLEALSAAADEITRDLAPGSVELRLRGREPSFVVTPPPAQGPAEAATEAHPAPTAPPAPSMTTDDGPSSRINLRLPEQLKTAVEDAAAREGRSVNAWLVRAASSALQRTDRDQGRDQRGDVGTTPTRPPQRLTGWVR